MITTKMISTSLGKIHLYDSGDGMPLVMVHGLLSSSDSFASLFESLVSQRRVIAFDFPDHGKSNIGTEFLSGWDGYGAALEQVVDALSLERFDLCGHSMGGGVAARYAAEHPEKVQKLILIDSVTARFKLPLKGRIPLVPLLGDILIRRLYGEKLFLDYFRHDVFFNAQKLDVERVKGFYRGFDSNRASILRGIRATANPASVVSALSHIEAKTLIIWGRQDPLIPLYVGNETVRKIKRADLQVVDDCGHSPMEEAPASTASLMVEFLG
ncbi:MAG: alpha/beta hydrolase [Deltaproteobacteria bacterium]|nr:alpha/beta hydrolase [Deltaproteobacteria bacterium]MBN2673178.1 alpha/beta hydrolase [Deltaproteobacteria bacterium]